jgi:hypothetical protein
MAQNLEKALKYAQIPYILACHLQIDADLDSKHFLIYVKKLTRDFFSNRSWAHLIWSRHERQNRINLGFGFLDNFIMIVAGEYIDLTLGVTLGISTMAAAALGKSVSAVFLINSF